MYFASIIHININSYNMVSSRKVKKKKKSMYTRKSLLEDKDIKKLQIGSFLNNHFIKRTNN